jgi:hypothetical protein
MAYGPSLATILRLIDGEQLLLQIRLSAPARQNNPMHQPIPRGATAADRCKLQQIRGIFRCNLYS